MGVSDAIILTFTIIIVIFGILFCYYRKSLSYCVDEKSPEPEIVIFVRNAENEIEGLVREYYNRPVNPVELWIIDCGSRDQTPQILEMLSRQFSELRLFFLPDMYLELCMHETIKHINAPALLLIDGTYLKCKDILQLIDNCRLRKMS